MPALPVVLVPGILTPAADRYAPLLAVLGAEVQAVVQDLDVYRPGRDPGYALDDEVRGVLRGADAAGLGRFHYVGYSAGAAVGLALAARHPDRLLSLVVDEPPTDWSAEDREGPWWQRMHEALSAPDVVPAFARLQVADDVDLAPPPSPAPAWMAARPAGITAFVRAVRDAPAEAAGWDAYDGPVLWLGGDRSTPHYREVRDRLAARLPGLRSRVFPGTHHLASAGVLTPDEYAAELRGHWAAS